VKGGENEVPPDQTGKGEYKKKNLLKEWGREKPGAGGGREREMTKKFCVCLDMAIAPLCHKSRTRGGKGGGGGRRLLIGATIRLVIGRKGKSHIIEAEK